jgi:hypothetical protein
MAGLLWVVSATAGSVLHGKGIPQPASGYTGEQEVSPEHPENASYVTSGPYYGYSPQSGKIWINDKAYLKHPEIKVEGHGTKLGMLSSIKEGEVVEFITVPNKDKPNLPFVVMIRRQ